MAITRAGLLRLRPESDPKNWRPHMLVLSGAPTRRWHLIDLANSLSHDRGLMTVATVVPSRAVTPERIQVMESNIRDYMARRGVQALVRVVSAPNPYVGVRRLVEAYGLGALVPNTILLGQSYAAEVDEGFCDLVKDLHRAQRNTVIVRADQQVGFGERRVIDIWWGGLKGNGGLMLILGYLLRTSISWKEAEVRLKMVVHTETAAKDARANMVRIISETRTGAIPHVLVARGRSFHEILRDSSADADIVLMGMAEPGDDFVEYWQGLLSKTQGLPSTVFVLAAEEMAFRDVLLQRTGR